MSFWEKLKKSGKNTAKRVKDRAVDAAIRGRHSAGEWAKAAPGKAWGGAKKQVKKHVTKENAWKAARWAGKQAGEAMSEGRRSDSRRRRKSRRRRSSDW